MNIETLRASLDEVDLEINKLLTHRFFICTQIAIEKKAQNLPIIDDFSKIKRKKLYSKFLGEYGERIYEAIHTESVLIQKKI